MCACEGHVELCLDVDMQAVRMAMQQGAKV